VSAKNKNSLAYLAAGASLIAFIAIGGVVLSSKPAPKDDKGCSAPLSGKTVFVLDQTDSLSEQTRAEISARVTKIVDEKVKIGELVTVFSITELSKKNLTPTFSYCKPAQTAEGASQSQRFVSANYMKYFAKPLLAAINAPIVGSKQSPIAQAIVDVSLSSYLQHPSSARLVVFSDLLEHTERFSMYSYNHCQDGVGKFRASRGAAVARPSFNGVDIQLHIVPRQQISADTGKCRNAFWKWFFTDNGGPGAGFDQFYLPG
jgi:hypothetical protein